MIRQGRVRGAASLAAILALGASGAARGQSVPAPTLQDIIPDWASFVPSTGPLAYSDPTSASLFVKCFSTDGTLPSVADCDASLPPSVDPVHKGHDGPAGTVSDAQGRVFFEGLARGTGFIFNETANAYAIAETRKIVTTQIGGGITAKLRIAGTGTVLASATSTTLAAAVNAVAAQTSLIGIGGRKLPPVISSGDVVQSTSVTGHSYQLTGSSIQQNVDVFIGPTAIYLGNKGQCDASFTTCESKGIGVVVVSGTELIRVTTQTTFNVTTTINETVTTTGTAFVDVPIAAAGRVHPAMQTMAFDQSGRLLARMERAGDARLAAPVLAGGRTTRWSMALEGYAARGDFDRSGDLAASDGWNRGLRGALALAARPDLSLGIAGEGGRWQWQLHDSGLPESARGHDWRLGAFVAWRPGRWQLNLAGFGGHQDAQTHASSIYGAGSSGGHLAARVWGLGAAAGYALPVGNVTLTPSAGLDWLGWSAPAYAETGGMAPLSVAAASRSQTRAHIGLAADWQGKAVAFGAFARGTFVSGDREGQVIASDGISQTGSFAIAGPASARASLDTGAHLDLALTQTLRLYANADVRFGQGGIEQGGQIGLATAF